MSTMQNALVEAGVHLPPQMKRIWLWLKDHQPQTAVAVAAALSLPQASSLLSQMNKRGMVSATLHTDRRGRLITEYSAAGREYALLPLPKQTNPPPDVQPATPPVKPPALTAAKAEIDIDAMTVAQARALYVRLGRVFGGPQFKES